MIENEIKVAGENDKTLGKDEAGLSTVEYIIILVLIAVIAIAAWQKFGKAVQTQVNTSQTAITMLGM